MMMARLEEEALQTLTGLVNQWTPGAFLEVQEQQRRSAGDTCHAHVGSATSENAPLVPESSAANRYMSKAATQTLQLEKHLGQGAFGSVVQVVCTMDGSRHAVKLANHEEGRLCQKTEMAALLRLGEHSNIVPVSYMNDTISRLPIVLGLGLFDLEDIVSDKRPATLLQKCMLLLDVTHGLHHAHQRNVLHCDLKPSNVIVFSGPNGRLVAKIGDWGLALSMSEERKPRRGTVGFIPPEAIRNTPVKCSPNQDGYALGLMFLQMFAIAPLKDNNMLMNALLWPPEDRAGYEGLSEEEYVRHYWLQTFKNATDGVSLAKMLQPRFFEAELQDPLLFCRLVGRMLSVQPRLRPNLLAVCWLLPAFAKPADGGSSNAEALPASTLGREDSGEPGPLAMRTTDGVDTNTGNPPAAAAAAATLARCASPVPLQSRNSAVAVATSRRCGIDGGVSGPARVRAAALAAAKMAAVAAAKRVLLSAQRQAVAESKAAVAAAAASVAAAVAVPTTLGGPIAHVDTTTLSALPTQGGSSSLWPPPPPPPPLSSQRAVGRRGPGMLPPRACNIMDQGNVASLRQPVGEARLPPPPHVVVDSLPPVTPERFRTAVFARAMAQRLERCLAGGKNPAVGSPTPLGTIRESYAGSSGVSSEEFSTSPSRSRSERAVANQADEGEHDGVLGRAFVPLWSRTAKRTQAGNFLSSRKSPPPPSLRGVDKGGRERAPLLPSPKEGKVTGTEESASDAMACGWYCEGPVGQSVRAVGGGKRDGVVVAYLARKYAQQLTVGYAHGRGVSTGRHPHGHCDDGEGKAAVAAATAASTDRTRTAAPGFDEGGRRLGLPQSAGGQSSVRAVTRRHGNNVAQRETGVGAMSANNPSWVTRGGAAAKVAAPTAEAPTPGSNHNHQRSQEMSQSSASRWSTTGAPSSHGDDNSGRGGRSARGRNRGSGIGEIEVQQTGRRTRRGKRRKKKGGHYRNYQQQHPDHLDDDRPNHHHDKHQHHHHQQQQQHRGHERGTRGVQGVTGKTGDVNAAPPQHHLRPNQHQFPYQHQHHQHEHSRGYARGFHGVRGEAGWTGGGDAGPRLAHARCAAAVMGSRPTPGGYTAWAGGGGVRVGVN